MSSENLSTSTQTSFVAKVIECLHNLPHLNYKFRHVEETFNLDIDGSYVQSLVVFCGFSLLLALLLLLAIVITWVCQCCLKKDNVRSRRHIHRLSTTLFAISVICFALLGVCLYGNEHTNKSVNSAVTGLADANQNIRLAIAQAQKLNATQSQASRHVEELTLLIETKSKSVPDINQTMLRETDTLLTQVSDKIDDVKQQLTKVEQIFGDLKFLDRTRLYGFRVEFERWILCITLISIMIGVLFAGVIAFCRQSRKGAILFSGLGIVIFIVSWLMFSLVFPITVAYADFCFGGARSFVETKINEEVLETFEFYHQCMPNPAHDNLPPKVPIAEINNLYTAVEANQQKLDLLLVTLFNRSEEIENISREISIDISNSFKSIGALESTLSCSSFHEDVVMMHTGFCYSGFLGSAIVMAALFLLGAFLFILLLLVSKSWHIFVRLPSDYVEVGEGDDHFSPRGQDAMPDNVYDTNIFNPRARQIGGLVDSAGTSLNNSGLPNGHSQHNAASATPLLVDSTTWLRNSTNASAPPAGNTINNSHSNGLRNSNYQLNNPYRHYQQQAPEFQEQFDI